MGVLGELQVADGLGERLAAGLEAVEVRLHDVATAFPGRALVDVRPLVSSGGKRIRPLLTLLASEFGTPTGHDHIVAATMVELAHVATLVQDDVIDAAAERRFEPSVNATVGNRRAVLVSDWFLACASELCASLGDLALVQHQAHTLHRLIRGQTAELVGPAPGTNAKDHYLEVIADKTASLLEFSSWLGATVAQADRTSTRALARYGHALGMAFQIRDDIHDIAPPPGGTGKPRGTDLSQGVSTLPILYAAEYDPWLADGPVKPDQLDAALERVAEGGLIQARLDLTKYGEYAKDQLTDALPIPAREALEALADYVVLS
ncbi:polyprenyl synthetase family protein [Tenggerimyces flavus]|uniref:Polyprenyl synthetase family protein n=1 Tax=Tenggerimyces flavus TaxID=1708749 RepID=A0ABV7YP34_9ACTN|nr:polyprenyl synthetase family protein [Tenggerimyces flavus]MBM7784665.1 heptaprenyl diphosphate synthase [Tenggerimyces flavus]